MGNCFTSNGSDSTRNGEKQRSQELDLSIRSDFNQDRQVNKLLLLGAGESGKSTILKQFITIYGKGFSDEDRKGYRSIVENNIITAIKTLCKYSEKFGPIRKENTKSLIAVDEIKFEEKLSPQLAMQIEILWRDPGIQQTYNARSNFQLNDSAAYFLSKVREVTNEAYIPSSADVLRARIRTTGIVEYDFAVDGNKFKVFDVGGQRNERKKWIHCFENVTAVLFIAALSEYDQVLFEDQNTNRMVEALNLFDQICNSRWFSNTSIILFLNKRDLFAEKITKVPLKKLFPEYSGGSSYEEGVRFIQLQFEIRNKNSKKKVYTHLTCATDTDNVAAVFNAVKDIIIRQSLDEAGLASHAGL